MQLQRGASSPEKATVSLLVILLLSLLSVSALLLFFPEAESTAPGSISLVSHIPQVLGAVYLYKKLWGLNSRMLRLQPSRKDSVEAFAVGAGLGLLFAYLSPQSFSGTRPVALSLILGLRQFFLVAVPEEMLFRGFYLRALSESMPLRFSIGVSSLAFALFHFGNLLAGADLPEVTVQVIIAALTGTLFGLQYVRGGLIPPILSHGALNFFLVISRTFFR